jgi:mRNA-degrading endonuclease RelE of RelBE toxin-antitoxin system
VFAVKYTQSALGDLRLLDARWRARILDEVDRHLIREPAVASRARKLIDLAPPADVTDAVQPFWQLRIDHLRVFYNVYEEPREVRVWGVRAKPPEHTTETVLYGRGHHEDDQSD